MSHVTFFLPLLLLPLTFMGTNTPSLASAEASQPYTLFTGLCPSLKMDGTREDLGMGQHAGRAPTPLAPVACHMVADHLISTISLASAMVALKHTFNFLYQSILNKGNTRV